MKSLLNIVEGVSRFFWYEPKTFFLYCKHVITKTYPGQQNFLKLSNSELNSELKNGKSLIRFGDGEAMLLTGRSIHFQPFSKNLREGLKKIIATYNANSPYILAIPHFAIEENAQSLNNRGRLRIWRLFRILFKNIFSKSNKYSDAVIFYHQNTFAEILKNLQVSHLIFISKEKNHTPELRQYLQSKDISYDYITSPDTDTFLDYKTIFKKTNDLLKKNPISVIITAAGPAGKIICYDFSNKGVQCIDLGHGIEIIGRDTDYTDRL